MPTLNGITASITTHHGPLEEFDVDEFPGGSSCYIVAHSGEQFWLNYSLDCPIRAKAVSVEFYVDGHRIDTQFPMGMVADGDGDGDGGDGGLPTVGPVKSSITSQYGRDDTGNVYRREVFFSLVDTSDGTATSGSGGGGGGGGGSYKGPLSPANALMAMGSGSGSAGTTAATSPTATATPDKAAAAKTAQAAQAAGTIEVKVYRAEKTGEWSGTISPDDIPTQPQQQQLVHGGKMKKKGISHTVRLGASIPAAGTVRYTFKNLDPENQPYAWFRFYYRSKKFMKRSRIGNWSLSRPSSPLQIPRPLSRSLTRKSSSLYHSLARGKDYLADRLSQSRQAETPEPLQQQQQQQQPVTVAVSSNAPSLAVSRIEAMIQGLEEDLATVTSHPDNTNSEVVQTLRSKLDQLKRDAALSAKQQQQQQQQQQRLPARQPKGKEPAGGTAIAEEEDDRTSSGSPVVRDYNSDGRSSDILGDSHTEASPRAQQPESVTARTPGVRKA